MVNEVMIIDPKSYGLEEKQATEIQAGLKTILEEREILIDAYKDTITLELTVENAPTFKSLRLQIAKNRNQGLKVWHKTNKAYFLAGGNFVQAIYNKEVAENERMESQLMEAEKHFENLELKRIAELQETRTTELESYNFSPVPNNIGEMEESVYTNFVSGVKLGFEAKEKADKEEKERKEALELGNNRLSIIQPFSQFIEEMPQAVYFGVMAENKFQSYLKDLQNKQESHERKEKAKKAAEKLYFDRRLEISELREFCTGVIDFELCEFGKLTEKEYSELKLTLNGKKEAYEKEQAKIKAENEKLKKEAQEKETRDKKRNEELRPYIVFIRDYSKLLNSNEEVYQKEFADIKKGAELQWEEDVKNQRKQADDRRKQDEALEKERKEKELLKTRLENKAKKEAQEKETREATEKAAAQAPDKDKLVKLINELNIEDPKLTTTEAKAAYAVIMAKFNGFKTWATQQVEFIK